MRGNVGKVVTVEICFTKTQFFECIILLGGDEATDPGSAEANLSLSKENKPWLLNRKRPTYVVRVWGLQMEGADAPRSVALLPTSW